MTIKTLTQLNGQAVDADWSEPRGIIQTVIVETTPGFIRKIQLGEAGLLIKAPQGTIGISLAELIRLAEAADDKMKPPVTPVVQQ